MNCPACSNPMVKARATNFGPEYDYCRTCKKEFSEIQSAYRVPAPTSGSWRRVDGQMSIRSPKPANPCSGTWKGVQLHEWQHVPSYRAPRIDEPCDCGVEKYGQAVAPPVPAGSSSRYNWALGSSTPCHQTLGQEIHCFQHSSSQLTGKALCNCGSFTWDRLSMAMAMQPSSVARGPVMPPPAPFSCPRCLDSGCSLCMPGLYP